MARRPLRVPASTDLNSNFNAIKNVQVKGRLRLEDGIRASVSMQDGRDGHPLAVTLYRDTGQEEVRIELPDCIGLSDIPDANLDLGVLQKLSEENSLLGSILLVYAHVISETATLTITPSSSRDPTHARFTLDMVTYVSEKCVPIDALKGFVAVSDKKRAPSVP